jgi:hypothetical protein
MKHFCRTVDRETSEILVPSTEMLPELGSRSRSRERTNVLFPLVLGRCQLSSSCLREKFTYLPVLPHNISLWPASTLSFILQRAGLPRLVHKPKG